MAEAIQQHTTSTHCLYQRDGVATKSFLHAEIRSAYRTQMIYSLCLMKGKYNSGLSVPYSQGILISALLLHYMTPFLGAQQFKEEAI